MTAVPTPVPRGRREQVRRGWPVVGRGLAGWAVLVLGGAVLGVALAAARPWGPEQQLTDVVGTAVARVPLALAVLREAVGLGDPAATGVALVLLAGALFVHRERRLGLWVVGTGLGAAVLGPAVAGAVALLPVQPGAGFPDAYAVGSTVAYGALVLVLWPAVPSRWRAAVVAGVVVLVVLIGGTRLAIGGRLLGDVLAGWALGLGWLAVAVTALRGRGERFGTELAPEVLRRAPERAARPIPARSLVALVALWVLLVGLLVAVGRVVAGAPPGSLIARIDSTVLGWFLAIRTPALTPVADVFSALGDTPTIVAGALTLAALALAAARHRRPLLFIAVVIVGELGIYLAVGTFVSRPRPSVSNLGLLIPPTSSFPSGHVSAAICLYGAAVFLAACVARGWWLWPAGVAAALVAASVGLGRVYFGVHYPTDVLGSVLFAVPWLLACRHVVRPRVSAHGSTAAVRR